MGYSFGWKKDITITNAFQKNLDESNSKPNKIRQTKIVNFTLDQWHHDYHSMI